MKREESSSYEISFSMGDKNVMWNLHEIKGLLGGTIGFWCSFRLHHWWSMLGQWNLLVNRISFT